MVLEHYMPGLPRLRLTRFSQVYQIWTPPSFNLAWSILTAFLVIPHEDHAVTLHKRIRLILGREKDLLEYKAKRIVETVPSIDEVERCILRYNPFTNNAAIFKIKFMQEAVKIFNHRLRLVASKFRVGTLDAAAMLLGTTLKLHVGCLRLCPKYHSPLGKDWTSNQKLITLLQENVDGEEVYSFCVERQACEVWRRETLGSLLRIINLPEDGVDRVLEKTRGYKSDLLVCLLTDPHDKDILYALYRSPLVQRWLLQIGYEVDPTSTGREGYSSFHYCKQYADPRLMRVLYFNAIHKVISSEYRGKRDDIEMLNDGLRRIRMVSGNDYEKSNNLATVKESNRQRARVTGEQIISFNTYQLSLVSEIRRIKSTEPHKLAIVILRCYLEHFYYRMGQNSEFDRYETYKNYEEYQDLTDGFTFLLFSQNLLSMKWELDISDRYKDMVLSLYLTLLSNQLLQRYKTLPEGGNVPRNYVCPLKFIPFSLRKDFRESAKQVIKTSKRVNPKLDFRSDVNSSFGLQDSHPEIVEELRVKRLVRYVQEAMNTFLDLQPLKGALLIERALQIIGETMRKTEKDTDGLLTPLLTSCVPPGLVNEFQNIAGQYLSTSRASVQRRMEAPNKIELFKRIQHELEVLLTITQPIAICMTNRAEELLIKKGKDELQKGGNEVFRNRLSKNMDIACDRVVEVRRFHFSEKSWLFKILSRKMLFNLESHIKFSATEKSLNLKEFLPLKFVIGFIIQHYSSYAEDMMTALQDLENILQNQNLSLDSTRINLGAAFSSCWKALDGIFPSTQEEKQPYFEFQEISNLFKSSKGHNWFSPEETTILLNAVKTQIHRPPSENSPNKRPSKKPQKSAKTDRQRPPENVTTLQQCLDEPAYRAALTSSQLPKRLEQKVAVLLNHKLLFLIDRIKHVRAIFEEDDRKVKSWWVDKDTATDNAIYFMSRRFYDELDTRAALEILFYDCTKLLQRRDLDILWDRLNCLFTGPNMRDVLPQGNPAMEAAGVLLGCPDVLSEVMGKLLELVDDLEVLEALWKGWKTLKPVAVDDFILEKLKEKDPASCLVLEKSERWRNYLRLLAFS